jgi:hypothetical protein
MNSPQESQRLGWTGRWSRELWLSGIALVTGFALLPGLIFFTGAAALGRYEDATPLRLYKTVYGGLAQGSVASWVVLFGPYGLYLLCRGLIACWRAGIKSPTV